MDVSIDERTREAWATFQRSGARRMPTGRVWRRLLAELEPTELVLYLDVLTDGSRDVFVAITAERLLSWTVLTDRFRRMVRSRIKVIEHRRTVNGVLRLSDGSSSTPLRLVGRPEQRAALLRALKLPADARPVAPVVPDLSTSPKTKAAYAASPTPPPATGPLADAVLASLGSAKAQLLVTATQVTVHPQWPGGDVFAFWPFPGTPERRLRWLSEPSSAVETGSADYRRDLSQNARSAELEHPSRASSTLGTAPERLALPRPQKTSARLTPAG